MSNFVTFGEKLGVKDRTLWVDVLELTLVSCVSHLVIFDYISLNHIKIWMYWLDCD